MERLYIVQGERGLFKAGRTASFLSRVGALKAEFRRMGDAVLNYRAFGPVERAVRAEQSLLASLAASYPRSHGKEWFRDVDFDDAARLAEQSIAASAQGIEAPVVQRAQNGLRPGVQAIHRAIAVCGTQGILADCIGVTQACLSTWIRRPNSQVPALMCSRIERVTGVPRQELRPNDWREIWPELAVTHDCAQGEVFHT